MKTALRHGAIWGIPLAATWVIIWFFVVTGRGDLRSQVQATGDFSLAVWVVVPIALGLGSALGTYASRTGILSYGSHLPRNPADTVPCALIAGVGMMALTDILFVWTFAAISIKGSPLTMSQMPSAVAAIGAVLAAVTLGFTISLAIPGYVVAAGCGFVAYVGSWWLTLADWSFYEFVTPASAAGQVPLLRPTEFLLHIVSDVLVAIACFSSWPLLRRDERATARGRRLTVSVLATLIVLGLQIDFHRGQNVWATSKSPADWDCRQLSQTGSRACLPRDLAWMANEYFTRLERIDETRAEIRVNRAPEQVIYTTDPATAAEFCYACAAVTLGVSLEEPGASWPSDIAVAMEAGGLTGIAPAVPRPTESWCDANFTSLTEAVAARMEGIAVSSTDFATLVAKREACHA